MVRFWVIPAVLGATLWCVACESSERPEFDRERIEAIEDLSESLANDLLRLSVAVRDRDLPGMRRYFAEQIKAAPLPSRPGDLEPLERWIHRHGWSAVGGKERAVPREAFLAELNTLLDHFQKPEDARFKVTGADFDAARPETS